MKLINNIKNRISKILWYVVIILFSISIYKVYLYYNYKKYVKEYLKDSNFYYELKFLQKEFKEYAQENKLKIKEYYFMPIDRRIIITIDDTDYKNKKVYGIILRFYTDDNNREFENIKDNSFIVDYEEFKKLKESSLIYKFNDAQLEELYKKVEKKSDMI